MQSSSESLWSEIKKYEDRLQHDPASYCFAPLADVYLKAGMLDDALAVAKAGVARYPGYVAGQMALARIAHRKGLLEECRGALEVVTSAVPEHAEAQRMLASLYRESGRMQDAARSLQILLELCPDDAVAATELAAVQHSLQVVDDDDLELIEFTEDDIIDEPETEDQLVERIKPPAAVVDDPWAAITAVENPVEPPVIENEAAALWAVPEQQVAEDAMQMAFATEDSAPEQEDDDSAAVLVTDGAPDPLITPTLAELYVSQGFPEKAADIYRRIISADPGNAEALARLAELEEPSAGEEPVAVPPQVVQAVDLPMTGTADKSATVTVLEGWLENIRRLRTCR